MFCSQCGKKNDSDAVFCESCGKRFLAATPDIERQPISIATVTPPVSPPLGVILYRVVLKGIEPDFDPDKAKNHLLALFKVSREKIEQLLLSPQFVVKRGLSLQTAARYQAAIEAAGGHCIVEPEMGPASDKSASSINRPETPPATAPILTKTTSAQPPPESASINPPGSAKVAAPIAKPDWSIGKILIYVVVVVVASVVIIWLFGTNTTNSKEWIYVGEQAGNNTTAYAAPATIRKTGNMVTMWTLFDFSVPYTQTGVTVLSVKSLSEFDCQQDQWRALAETQHSGHMGAGVVVYSSSNIGTWQVFLPGVVGADLLKLACGKR